MDDPNTFETKGALVFYDEMRRLICVTYRGVLSPDTTAAVYGWLMKAGQNAPPEASRGIIFDFRSVTEFVTGNLYTARNVSNRVNTQTDYSKFATVLLVKTLYQEQMVKVSMKVTAEEPRKRILKTEEAALKFINEWNTQIGLSFGLSDEVLNTFPTHASMAAFLSAK